MKLAIESLGCAFLAAVTVRMEARDPASVIAGEATLTRVRLDAAAAGVSDGDLRRFITRRAHCITTALMVLEQPGPGSTAFERDVSKN